VPTFLPPVDYPVGAGPFDVKAGDFNGDGIPDLATATVYIHTVSVLLSNGDGTFQPARDTPIGPAGPNSLAVGDYNEDGRLDLATANGNANGNSITILLGQGDGTFAPAPTSFASYTDSLVAGDLNGDGTLDLVTTSVVWIDDFLDSTYVSVYLGHGDGTFAFDRGYGPYAGDLYGVLHALKLADFDGDCNADVVATDVGYGSGTFLFHGNGDGTLQEPSAFDPGTDLWTMADFNADGIPDHAYLDQGALAVNLGNADGSFGPMIMTPIGSDPLAFAVADFNADGRPDAAVTNFDPRQVTVLFNDGVWDGSPPVPSITIDDVTVTEGNTGTRAATFTVTLSVPCNQSVTMAYATADGSATAGDYQAASGTLTFAPGETSKTITVLVIGDRVAEPNETIFVSLSNPTNATIADTQGVVTIIDDEPRISISDVSKKEGKKGQTTQFTFTVTLSAAYDQPVTMSFQTVNGTATTGDGDYVAKTGTLTFKPGETSKTITIVVNGDSKKEADETFYLDLFGLSSNALFTKNRGIGTILNDD
jgi:hypothetical protein